MRREDETDDIAVPASLEEFDPNIGIVSCQVKAFFMPLVLDRGLLDQRIA